MPTIDRMTNARAFSEPSRAWAIAAAGRTHGTTPFSAAVRKWFARSLALAFATGAFMAINTMVWDGNADAGTTANYAFYSVGTILNLPLEGVITLGRISPHSSQILRDTLYFVAMPYQTLAYSGGYLGNLTFHAARDLVAWL